MIILKIFNKFKYLTTFNKQLQRIACINITKHYATNSTEGNGKRKPTSDKYIMESDFTSSRYGPENLSMEDTVGMQKKPKNYYLRGLAVLVIILFFLYAWNTEYDVEAEEKMGEMFPYYKQTMEKNQIYNERIEELKRLKALKDAQKSEDINPKSQM